MVSVGGDILDIAELFADQVPFLDLVEDEHVLVDIMVADALEHRELAAAFAVDSEVGEVIRPLGRILVLDGSVVDQVALHDHGARFVDRSADFGRVGGIRERVDHRHCVALHDRRALAAAVGTVVDV